MSRNDYDAISRIIVEVTGKNTLICEKLLEGVQFYFNNKKETIKVIKSEEPKSYHEPFYSFDREADEAMKKYTAKLKKENEKHKPKKARSVNN